MLYTVNHNITIVVVIEGIISYFYGFRNFARRVNTEKNQLLSMSKMTILKYLTHLKTCKKNMEV